MDPMSLEDEAALIADTSGADPFEDVEREVSQDPAFIPEHHDDVAGPTGVGFGVPA